MTRLTEIKFEKVTSAHLDTIFSWLTEPHVREFWDNTQAHKDDIVNFSLGRKSPSSYADGQYVYSIAYLKDEPFGMLMTIKETHKENIGEEKLKRLSKTGHTYSIEYMIGDPKFLGRGYGAQTLSDFIDFFRESIDLKADTFLIDPDSANLRAKHVYMKAGFKHVCDFMMDGDVSGAGKIHHLLIKKFEPKILLLKATLDDYPCIQNMARFYVYDLSRDCGSISSDWAIPEDGLYESFDFKNYFLDLSRKAYLIKVYDEIAGFVLLNQSTKSSANTWNMGEFFIIAKFQGQGIANQVANQIWNMHPGTWEVSVIPNNKSALKFWEKVISEFTSGHFNKQIKEYAYDEHCPRRVIFEFDTQNHIPQNIVSKFVVRRSEFTDASNYPDTNLNGLELISENLFCRTLSMKYAQDIVLHFTAKIAKWMWPAAPKTLTEINQHIHNKQKDMSKGVELALVVLRKDTGEFLGYVSLHALNTQSPEIGIWIKEDAHGLGYGFESLLLLIKWANKHLSFNYLKYPVEKNNIPSRALAEKLGGKIEDMYIKKSESGQTLDEVEYRFYKEPHNND